MSNMSDKDKKDNDEKDARARVLETAERAGRHVNEASVDLRRRQPADLARRFIESLSMDERREILDQLTGELMVKAWRHPFKMVVNGEYHKCAACGGPINDEVVLVTERLRSGDRHFVFCDRVCLGNYDGW